MPVAILINATAEVLSIGAECGRQEFDADGCPTGLTCLPVEFQGTQGEYCLEPCRDFDDCTDSSVSYSQCASIQGSTSVGYCSP